MRGEEPTMSKGDKHGRSFWGGCWRDYRLWLSLVGGVWRRRVTDDQQPVHQRDSRRCGRIVDDSRWESVTEFDRDAWLQRTDAFAIDPASLPLRPGPHHQAALFGVMQDCGPDRWGRVLIERAVRKKVLRAKPYRDID